MSSSLEDIVRSKEAANRPEDLAAALPILRQLLRELSKDCLQEMGFKKASLGRTGSTFTSPSHTGSLVRCAQQDEVRRNYPVPRPPSGTGLPRFGCHVRLRSALHARLDTARHQSCWWSRTSTRLLGVSGFPRSPTTRRSLKSASRVKSSTPAVRVVDLRVPREQNEFEHMLRVSPPALVGISLTFTSGTS